jgi:hypothetical protein
MLTASNGLGRISLGKRLISNFSGRIDSRKKADPSAKTLSEQAVRGSENRRASRLQALFEKHSRTVNYRSV